MNYVPIFDNNPSFIALGVVVICVIIALLVITIARRWVDKLKWFTNKRINGIGFILGLIIGLSVSGAHGFKIFNEFYDICDFLERSVWLEASFTNMCVSIMFTGFLLFIPFKLLTNLYQFTLFKHPKQKFMKLIGFYAGFGLIAIGVSLLMYPLAPTFFSLDTTSQFSFHPTPERHGVLPVKPTLYLVGNYMLIVFFKVKSLSFTRAFIIYLVIATLIAALIIYLFIKINPHKLPRFMKKVTLISDKSTDYLNIITPVFTFNAIITSLEVQPAGTGLRFALILILYIILFVVIWGVDWIWAFTTGSMKLTHFCKYSWKAYKKVLKHPFNDNLLKVLCDDRSFRGFRDFNDEQSIYDIFVTSIFGILIVAYLGFSAGPLYEGCYYAPGGTGVLTLSHLSIEQHIFFWVALYIFGFFLTFVYAFRYNDSGPYKIILSGSLPWIRWGYNAGMLSYFNAYFDKLAVLSTYNTYLAIACKHDHHYRKLIK